ncbi:SgcJ/EcaC family oxidoreductase [Variovorax sp. GT1P44]|uniref:SgcJ/EcaC family oxidoreductase n=1 Tax=Variovorax sp. GT1P44 TaxID=3443742 RepID=UPI003F4778D4
MHRRSSALTIICAVALLLCCSGSSAQNQPLGSSADEEAIRNVVVAMTDGFNAHDSKAATRMYTADADLVTVRGERFKGTVEFEKGLGAILTTRAREAKHRTLNVSVRFIRPDVALVHVTNELSGLLAPDGQRLPPQQELSIRVLVKEGQDWHVAAFHNTLVQPFGSSPPK